MKKILVLMALIVSTSIFSQEKIKEVGKVVFEKQTNSFIFYFLKNDKVQSVILNPTDKAQLNLLKKLENKTILLEGEIKPYVNTQEGIVYREEVNNPLMKELGAELLKVDTKKILEDQKYISSDKALKVQTGEKVITISNKAANTIIAIAGTVIGVAVGPVALVPVSVYLIKEKMEKK